MNWFQKICQSDDSFSGNCAMYAIALGKKAQETGKKVTMVVCSNVWSEELLHGEPSVYHVAVEIDGILYDGSGQTTLEEVGNFATEYDDSRPKCSFLELDDAFIAFARTQTNWSISWEEYYSRLS